MEESTPKIGGEAIAEMRLKSQDGRQVDVKKNCPPQLKAISESTTPSYVRSQTRSRPPLLPEVAHHRRPGVGVEISMSKPPQSTASSSSTRPRNTVPPPRHHRP